MSNPKGAGNDPSMDDILKSIRKIISDDEARAQVGQAPLTSPADGQPAPARRDDVLLLTNPIEEPKSGASAVSAPVPPRIDPVQAAEMPQPSIEPPADGSLLGTDIAGAASSAFARLNQAMQDSVPAPTAADPGPSVVAGGKTVEDLVKEMLRPMLKDWLDRNLPGVVERYVEREIVRLTRR